MDEKQSNWEQIKEQHKNREIEDYSGFIEGDYEPSLGKKISILIIKEQSFIVYIDDSYMVEWSTNDHYKWVEYYKNNRKFQEDFGLVINRIGYLEEVSKSVFPLPILTVDSSDQKGKSFFTHITDKGPVSFFSHFFSDECNKEQDLVIFKRLLGESMARLLDDKDTKNAIVILDQAESYINQRKRSIILKSAFISSLILCVLGFSFYLIFICYGITNCVLNDKSYSYILAMCFGGIGALLSVMQRGSHLVVEPSLTNRQYCFEGFIRILYGMMAALIFLLGFNGGLFLNVIKNSPHEFELLLLFSIVVGYSERFIPTFIAQIEDGLIHQKNTAKRKN